MAIYSKFRREQLMNKRERPPICHTADRSGYRETRGSHAKYNRLSTRPSIRQYFPAATVTIIFAATY